MKRWLRIGAALLLAASAQAQEDFAARLDLCAAILQGLSPQAFSERAVCESMLAKGAALGWWGEDAVDEMTDWLGSVFTPPATARTPRERTAPFYMLPPDPVWQNVLYRGTIERNPASATAFIAQWLNARLSGIDSLRRQTVFAMNRIALEQAQSAWLSAKTAADLAPAVNRLAQTKATLGFRWRESNLAAYLLHKPGVERSGGSGILPETEGIEDFYDCWAIVGSPEPFLLPDPEADPAAFARARRDWFLMQRTSQRFLKRPHVARRFDDLDAIFRERFAQIQSELNTAILRDAPAVEFERALMQLQALVLPARPREELARLRAPVIAQPPRNDVELPPDYREAIAWADRSRIGMFSSAQEGREEYSLQPRGDFQRWLDWRRATDEGDAARTEAGRKALLQNASTFEPKVAAYLRKRLAAEAAHRKKPAASVEPVATKLAPIGDLVTALQQCFPERNGDGPAGQVHGMIEAWLVFDRGEVLRDREQPGSLHFWREVASQPGGAKLCALRDRVARDVLAQLLPDEPADESVLLARLFRSALEKCGACGSHELLARLLALDAIAGVFPDYERTAWRGALEALERALAAPTSEPQRARYAWTELLRNTTSPGIAAFATKKLKELSESVRPER
jgi:hypothetical protein